MAGATRLFYLCSYNMCSLVNGPDWWPARRRFRCRKSGSKDIKLDADFYGCAVRRQRRLAVLAAVEETLRPGLRPPPPGVRLAEWNRVTETESKRLVDRARS